MSTPLCVVCGSVCPDPGLWVVRGGEACSEGCASKYAQGLGTITRRRAVDVFEDHAEPCIPCYIARTAS